MILTCPSCGTRYQTDGSLFKAPGRNVRCAKCSHVWFQAAPALEPEPETEPVMTPVARVEAPSVAPAPQAAAPDRGSLNFAVQAPAAEPVPEPAARSRRPWGAILAQSVGWVILIGLIGAIGWSFVQYRQTIAGLWPQSASLYAVMGLPVSVRGIELTNIAYRQEYEDGQPVLSVTGKVSNVGSRELPVPEIRVMLLDDAKHELYHWTFDVGIPTLKPGAESAFVTRLSSPPAEARNLNVRFAASGEAR